MPKTTRTSQEVDAVRDKILNCAMDILAKRGYESLSMLKIGHKMNMTAANLYNYYGSKDELLIAIHKKAFGMLYDKLLSAINSANTPVGRFKKLTYGFVEFGIRNMNLYDIMFNRHLRQYTDYIGTPLEEMSSDEHGSSIRTLYLAIETIRDYLKTRPELRAVDPKEMAIQSMSALHGIISLYNSGSLATFADDPENTMKTFVDTVVHSVID